MHTCSSDILWCRPIKNEIDKVKKRKIAAAWPVSNKNAL
jgi:hypothetical protein